jgi:hypothetical protein
LGSDCQPTPSDDGNHRCERAGFPHVRGFGTAEIAKTRPKIIVFESRRQFSTGFSTGVENLGKEPNGLASKAAKIIGADWRL